MTSFKVLNSLCNLGYKRIPAAFRSQFLNRITPPLYITMSGKNLCKPECRDFIMRISFGCFVNY